ncbi:hypothetical protein GGR58DRAFT_503161 [Xylaria digitata]|nr:hypothetical protein GGR58DRAFT_503161 [Xylaria digitata]
MTKPNDAIAILVTAFTLGGFIAFYLFAYRFRVRCDDDSDDDNADDDDGDEAEDHHHHEGDGGGDSGSNAAVTSSAFSSSSASAGGPAEEILRPEPVVFATGARSPGIRSPTLGDNAV